MNSFMAKAYPDYPPPSFLEATSVPASLENTTSVSLSQSPITPTEPTTVFPVTSSSQTYMSPAPASLTLPTGNEVDSDTSSLEIIDMDSLPVEGQLPSGHKLEENIRRDWLNRRGTEFPSPPENQARSRSKIRSRAILDSDSEDGTEEIPYAPRQTSQKIKHLSSLRTLFPYRAMTVGQPLSASPNSSPYSSRSSSSFLSATSLKMSMSTTSISSVKGESFFSRKFLSFKGKEHAKEFLDTWEVVETQPSSNIPSENFSSPIRSQSFTSGMPVSSQVVKEQAPLVSSTPPVVTTSATAPHPLSLRDRKPPPVPFVTRPRKKVPHPPPKPAPLVSVPQGPILVSVRTRIPPARNPLHLTSSPLVHDSWCPKSLEACAESNAVLQQAIATPLPLSPIEGGFPTASVLPSPADSMPVSTSAHSPTSPTVLDHQIPVQENDIIAQDMPSGFRLSHRTVSPSPSKSMSVLVPSLAPTFSTEPSNQISMVESNNVPSPEGNLPPVLRHHYPGRPLPQPPGTTRLLPDSTSGIITHDQAHCQQSSKCPEGLLIDLNDDSSFASLVINERNHLLTPSSVTSSSSSVDLLGSIADIKTPVITEHTRIQGDPYLALSDRGCSQETNDLDVLVTQISEAEHREGLDYDALLLLSEFIEPPSTPQRSTHSASAPGTPPREAQTTTIAKHANVPVLGSVRLERRRTMKDGRVKLKLVAMLRN
ncbi:hypothetical protein C0992_011949 [Termitomyces sp. T32_za158]|nr:hypothetical protein C0992_011949 [Termitomyces sp. T32_za158]